MKKGMLETIVERLKLKAAAAAGVNPETVVWRHPEVEEFGDYATNLALVNKGGREMAEKIAAALSGDEDIDTVKVEGPGFVNVRLKERVWPKGLIDVLGRREEYGKGEQFAGRKMMVEYAHPNTHKELHIGHMRTLITGEAVARILEKNGAEVFRANYQGDIGPHVAKAIWGTEKILAERGLSWEEAEKMSLFERAHLLGEGYIKGSSEYETNKQEIDDLNKGLYEKKADKSDIYSRTRQWSLDYYKSFYERFGTKFDRLFFESEVADRGKELVMKNVGRVFTESEGAIIFDGEKFGLHKRVFVTADSNPTYEGKEMALAYLQRETFNFDRCIHVVANEQTGYFAVVIKALEELDKEFVGREYHLPMGMVSLVGKKIASRTGVIMTVDSLIDEVKALGRGLVKAEGMTNQEIEEIVETVTLAAVKYSVLKTNPELNVVFDVKQSVNLEGSSGPYLQYTYARCRSVIFKSGGEIKTEESATAEACKLTEEELRVMRWLQRYPEAVAEAGVRLGPNVIGTYLQELAARFNTFYNQHSILSADNESQKMWRLRLTSGVAGVLKNGLELLGIRTLERM
jgi:arginyl-tRNA synthetase